MEDLADRPSKEQLIYDDISVSTQVSQQDFRYQDLSRADTEIRLITILPRNFQSADQETIYCEISHTVLQNPSPYKALSYTWGDPTDSQHSILLDGCPFSVRKNLWVALQRFREETKAVTMWIDAICINQANIHERNHQVSNMRRVYQQASQVMVWLGPSADDSEVAFNFARTIYAHLGEIDWLLKYFQHPEISHYLQALANVFSRQYWSRVWIIQEIAVASNVDIYCGESEIQAHMLYQVQSILYDLQDSAGHFMIYKAMPFDIDSRITLVWRGLRPIWESHTSFLSGTSSLFHNIQYHLTKRSTDPRDMVYGLVGLTEGVLSQGFTISYENTTAKVYSDLFKLELKTSGRLDILTFASGGTSNLTDLPSWVPDWSFHQRGHTRLQNIREPHFKYTASGNSRAMVRFPDESDKIVVVRGINLCPIVKVGILTQLDNPQDLSGALLAIKSWWNMLKLADEDSKSNRIEFCRSLLANRFRSQEYASLGKNLSEHEFLHGLFEAFAELWVATHGSSTSNPPLSKELKNRPLKTPASEIERQWRLWVQDLARYIWDRRFFLGTCVKMGLSPKATREGDILFLPLGCSHPVVLRPACDYYLVVGEAYANGYMYGAAMEFVQQGQFVIESFVLR